MELFTAAHAFEWIGVTILFTTLFFLCSFKLLGGLQQAGYSTRKLFAWLKRKDNLVFTTLSLLSFILVLSSAVLALCFSFVKDSGFISLCAFLFFCIAYFLADRKYALKVKIVKTARFLRLTALYLIFLFLFVGAFTVGFTCAFWSIPHPLAAICRYIPMGLFIFALPVVLAVANFFDKLFEVPHNARYLRRAEKTMASCPNVIKIGITGSYGKTSVKHILSCVLGERYRVLMTPASYNTPMGIARCVNGVDFSSYDLFLAEMGARNKGDIEELCDLVMPDYSVITGICPQHLQSFGSVEDIVAAKGEILYGTAKGAVLGNDEYTLRLYDNSPVETLIAGQEVRVTDVVADTNSTRFTLWVENEKRTVSTRLLGEHTADNMCLAATLAYFLDFSIDEIVRGLEKTEPIPHRLQPVYAGGVAILDDSYNSNVKGAEDAVAMLKKFTGRHFIVTPGLVELGIIEEEENKKLGGRLVGLDRVILVGDTLVSVVKKGYLEGGGEPEKLAVVPTLDDAQKLLKEELQTGDAVLFLNDLPDVCNII